MKYIEFVEIILKGCLIRWTKDFNWDNEEFLEKIYMNYLEIKFKPHQTVVGGNWIKRIIYPEGKSRFAPNSLQYWIGRGWTKEEAVVKVSECQKKKSRFSTEFWIKKGYSEDEAKLKVSQEQKKVSDKGWSKKERKIGNVFSVKYWESKGLSPEDAKYEALSRNPSSREFYETDEEWKEARRKIANRVSSFIKENPEAYSSFFGKVSKAEIDFFKRIEDLGIIHNAFNITIKDEKGTAKFFKADGYYKSKKGIILIEYDGEYWHSRLKEYDIWREDLILEKRKDILGILRISDSYKVTDIQLKNNIKDAIRKIENQENRKIKFY